MDNPATQLANPYLLADVELDAVASSLSGWSWLIGGGWTALVVSAVGDVFLVNPAGAIARLDTGAGRLEKLAETLGEFEAALDDPTIVAEWFLEGVVDELRVGGKCLNRGQCYGFTILPIFEGRSYMSENRFPVSATEHIRFTGDMHLQLRDVSDGDSVEIVVRE
jgi:hypothetical protein